MTAHTLQSDARASNATGVAAMMASMASFTANDTCVKLLGETVPLGEIIFCRNAFAITYILIFAGVFGGLTLPKDAPMRPLAWRMFAEVFSTYFFLSALIALPIADAITIGQFAPLAITGAAAIFLKERVGWRRWLAAFVGFLGVVLIVRPGSTAFSPAALLVLVAVGLVVLRDIMTRRIPVTVPTLTLTLMSAATVGPSALALLPFQHWHWPPLRELALMSTAGLFLTGGYALIVVAMRAGDVAFVAPFRYSVILFGILSGFAVWHQLPDAIQLAGIAVLTAAGLYTFHRERRLLATPLAET
jgi:drug/metabolite transporter (DMT)-like permease